MLRERDDERHHDLDRFDCTFMSMCHGDRLKSFGTTYIIGTTKLEMGIFIQAWRYQFPPILRSSRSLPIATPKR
jgi:hypothetical protein